MICTHHDQTKLPESIRIQENNQDNLYWFDSFLVPENPFLIRWTPYYRIVFLGTKFRIKENNVDKLYWLDLFLVPENPILIQWPLYYRTVFSGTKFRIKEDYVDM